MLRCETARDIRNVSLTFETKLGAPEAAGSHPKQRAQIRNCQLTFRTVVHENCARFRHARAVSVSVQFRVRAQCMFAVLDAIAEFRHAYSLARSERNADVSNS